MSEPTTGDVDTPWPEIQVTLDGRTWDLKPTFDAIVRIERRLDAPLVAILRRFDLLSYGVTDVAVIVYEGIRAAHGNETPAYETIGEGVVRAGLTACMAPPQELLSAYLNGLRGPPDDDAEDAGADDGAGPTPPLEAGASGGDSSASPC